MREEKVASPDHFLGWQANDGFHRAVGPNSSDPRGRLDWWINGECIHEELGG